jgi:predicted Rdx family selenoprotein
MVLLKYNPVRDKSSHKQWTHPSIHPSIRHLSVRCYAMLFSIAPILWGGQSHHRKSESESPGNFRAHPSLCASIFVGGSPEAGSSRVWKQWSTENSDGQEGRNPSHPSLRRRSVFRPMSSVGPCTNLRWAPRGGFMAQQVTKMYTETQRHSLSCHMLTEGTGKRLQMEGSQIQDPTTCGGYPWASTQTTASNTRSF